MSTKPILAAPITLAPPVPTPVEVIFVASYRKAKGVSKTEVDTPRLEGHATKQKKRSPSVKTYAFTVATLGEVRTKLEKEVKPSETVTRIDFLAHGDRWQTTLRGELVADNVLFDSPPAVQFDDFVSLFTLAEWNKNGQLDSTGRFWKTALTWQSAVQSRLASDATIHVFACHSGGEDTNTLTNTDEGVLLAGISRLFGRTATGLAGYLYWTESPFLANVYTKMVGVPVLGTTWHGRVQQSPNDLGYYRDLESLTRAGFSAALAITRKP